MTSPKPPSDQTWTDIMRPTFERCELAARVNQNYMLTPEGAEALGALIKLMARLLDQQEIKPDSNKAVS